jgi:hypothetical protein
MPDGKGGTTLLVGQSNYELHNPEEALALAAVVRLDRAATAESVGGSAWVESEVAAGAPSSTGPLALADYDGDGDLDLFIGGRVVPGAYPVAASSRLFRNQDGNLVLDQVNQAALSQLGLVSAAIFSDVDVDGDQDLLLALEWGPITLFSNERGRFTPEHNAVLERYPSRWQGIATGDLNEDGRPDIVATSWGRNTGHRLDTGRPLLLYHADFDRNGSLDLINAQFETERQAVFPLESFSRLLAAMPRIRQRIPTFMAYADATVEDLLGPQLEEAQLLEITTLDHMLFLSSDGSYDAVSLPAEAQLAPSSYAGIADFDGDGHEDLFLTQNFFPTELQTPRLDAGRGLLLRGDGRGNLAALSGQVSGIAVYGDQRGAAYADYDADGRTDLVISQNGAATRLYRNDRAVPGARVRLIGTAENPYAIGAAMRLRYREGTLGPLREIQAGSGYWSHNGLIQVLGFGGEVTDLWVRWPGGAETEIPLQSGQPEIVVRQQQ